MQYLVWKLLSALLGVEIALFNGLPSLSHCWDALTRVELDPSPADTLFVNHHIFNTHHTLNVAIAICQQIYKYVVEILHLCITSTFLICTQDIPTVSRVPGKLGPGKLDSWAPRPNLPWTQNHYNIPSKSSPSQEYRQPRQGSGGIEQWPSDVSARLAGNPVTIFPSKVPAHAACIQFIAFSIATASHS